MVKDNSNDYCKRVTINLAPALHRRLVDIKYSDRHRGKISIERLIVDAVTKEYGQAQSSSGVKVI